jgi:hypothetical protein
MKNLVLAAALIASISPALASPVIPDPTITPGVVRTTDAFAVCDHNTRELRHASRARAEIIMRTHEISMTDRADYEIDHLIPLGIGGADDNANLWPQPRKTIETEWTAERKDVLEHKLHAMVCKGEIEITDAQAAFAQDWTAAWTVYIGRN